MGYFDSIPSRINATFTNWDKNNNGTLDYPVNCKPKQTCAGPDERTEVSVMEDNGKKRELTMSIDRLVLSADANKDGKVTKDELATLMKTFDHDGDNDLPTRGLVDTLLMKKKLEGDRFEDAYGTTTKWRSLK